MTIRGSSRGRNPTFRSHFANLTCGLTDELRCASVSFVVTPLSLAFMMQEPLKLIESKTTSKGIALLHYQPVRA